MELCLRDFLVLIFMLSCEWVIELAVHGQRGHSGAEYAGARRGVHSPVPVGKRTFSEGGKSL